MRVLFYVVSVFIIFIACMGIFFSYFAILVGTNLKQMNINLILIFGLLLLSLTMTIFITTPVLYKDFWYSLKKIKEHENELLEEKIKFHKLRKHYENLINNHEKN